MRDYIHIVDLAKGHVAAVDKIKDIEGEEVYNLGTGLVNSQKSKFAVYNAYKTDIWES